MKLLGEVSLHWEVSHWGRRLSWMLLRSVQSCVVIRAIRWVVCRSLVFNLRGTILLFAGATCPGLGGNVAAADLVAVMPIWYLFLIIIHPGPHYRLLITKLLHTDKESICRAHSFNCHWSSIKWRSVVLYHLFDSVVIGSHYHIMPKIYWEG